MKVKYRRPENCKQENTPESFHKHLTSYIFVNGLLWLLWLFFDNKQNVPYPIYSMFGWGIGLFFHALKVAPALYSKEYEKRKREEEFI